MPDFGFQNLDTYHLAKMLVIETYKTTDTFSNSEKYGLSQQMNRAAVSIPSNIAEGYAREGSKDKCHFLNIAYGSLMELVCQFEIARELDFVEEEKYQDFKNKAFKLAIKISNFKKYLVGRADEKCRRSLREVARNMPRSDGQSPSRSVGEADGRAQSI